MTGPHRYSKKADRKAATILQMKLSLVGTNPLVWRRVLVPASFTLSQLHDVFQVVMGWKNCHLYEFKIKTDSYGMDDSDFENDPPLKEAKRFRLSDALAQTDQFTYIYDFGDDWLHEVIVEKSSPWSDTYLYPACIGGENACPPEDCHGVHGYFNFLEKLSDPSNPEHLSIRRWVGGFFDPKSFDANRINQDHLWPKKW